MNIKLIDQALTVAITGLMYSSGFSLVWAFGLHIATREKSVVDKGTLKQAITDTSVAEKPVAEKPVAEKSVAEKPVTVQNALPLTKPTGSIEIIVNTAEPQEITCEPVNWKKWKVADLRKASICSACGVRIKPIGSSRNLPKANLIAQYEQNLKRFTKRPQTLAVGQVKTA
ncbi:MAG: hypothetical protein WA885_20875 [Phormidesmis sp.]